MLCTFSAMFLFSYQHESPKRVTYYLNQIYVKTKPGEKNSKDGRRITHMYNNKPSEYQWQRRLTANKFLRFEIYNLTWNETYEHKHIVFGK